MMRRNVSIHAYGPLESYLNQMEICWSNWSKKVSKVNI